MSKEFTKEDVIQNKKEAIRSLNKLIESYINDPSDKHLKKAHLISFWLKDYVRFLNFEEEFDPTRNIAYKRGNIVKLNFGFNIGSEYGGLHYAVVLDNKNDHNSPVLTVIPLTSIKDSKSVHHNSVDLGSEIYRLLKLKHDTILKSVKDETDEVDKMVCVFSELIRTSRFTLDELKKLDQNSSDFKEKIANTSKNLDVADHLKYALSQKSEHNFEMLAELEKIGKEIAHMKKGSIALVNQITTISKMRIFDPRNLKGVLAGVSLSEESMDKINQKVKELYIF